MNTIYETDYYDPLTRLPNLVQFRNLAQKLLDSTQMRKQGIAFVYFNIENFRFFNQRYGITAGDSLLQTISQLIQASFQGRVISRLDVDHFAVVTEMDGLERKIEELWEDVHSFRRDTRVELKAGIYILDDAVKDATIALDRSKMACDMIHGRFGVKFGYYDPIEEEAQSRERKIVECFDDSLKRNEIIIYYQPIVRTMTAQICGFEALARWQHPELGELMPDEFIPILEKHRMVKSLDLYMVDIICRNISILRNQGRIQVPISVNLSRLDFMSEGLVEEIQSLTKKYGVSKELLRLEVTESAFGDEMGFVKASIDAFRREGYEVWMDDFGTGYSSLNSIMDYDFDVIKIDMSIVKDFKRISKAGIIISSMVDLAKRMNFRTLAEGVESDEAYEFLREIGCEQVQGYLFGMPEPFEEIMESVSARERVLEKQEERDYQNAVGHVNLYETGLLSKALDKNGLMPGGLPMAILEMDGDHLHYLRANDAYIDFLKEMGIRVLEDSEEYLNRRVDDLPSKFMKAAQKCRLSGRAESVDYIRNGQFCNMRIRMINDNEYKVAFLVTCLNLSALTNMEQKSDLEEVLKYLYSAYERVDVFSEDGLEIKNVYRNSTAYSEEIAPMSQRKTILNFVGRNIMPMDSLRFVQFYDLTTLRDRITDSRRSWIVDYFRTIDESGGFTWKKYTIIQTKVGKNVNYISCICPVELEKVRWIERRDT